MFGGHGIRGAGIQGFYCITYKVTGKNHKKVRHSRIDISKFESRCTPIVQILSQIDLNVRKHHQTCNKTQL